MSKEDMNIFLLNKIVSMILSCSKDEDSQLTAMLFIICRVLQKLEVDRVIKGQYGDKESRLVFMIKDQIAPELNS